MKVFFSPTEGGKSKTLFAVQWRVDQNGAIVAELSTMGGEIVGLPFFLAFVSLVSQNVLHYLNHRSFLRLTVDRSKWKMWRIRMKWFGSSPTPSRLLVYISLTSLFNYSGVRNFSSQHSVDFPFDCWLNSVPICSSMDRLVPEKPPPLWQFLTNYSGSYTSICASSALAAF